MYLSRPVDGVFEIESWRTPDGGTTWTSTAITGASEEQNVRPVSPRGLIPFSGDLSVIWMRDTYPRYLDFRTSIATILATGGNRAPVAATTLTPPTGSGPLTVALDAAGTTDEDGQVVSYRWDFGDGTSGAGERATHTFRAPGTYFPRLTVTDDAGASDVYVSEVIVGPWLAAETETGPAWAGAGHVTLSGTVDGHNQETTYHFENGIDALDRRSPDVPLSDLDHEEHVVSTRLDGLVAGATYRYRVVATNETGTATGAERTVTVTPAAGSAYASAVRAVPGLLGHWRLGERQGSVAASETGANAGTYAGAGVILGQPGALSGDPDTSAAFDGVAGEMSAATAPLSAEGTLEGWFDWRDGIALMRDNNNTTAGGWILAYATGEDLLTRIAGVVLDRPARGLLPGRLASLRGDQARQRYPALRRRAAAPAAADVRLTVLDDAEHRPLARHAQRPLHEPVDPARRRRGRRLRQRVLQP